MIKIYSTFSEDIILNDKPSHVLAEKGGPAFFIEKIFKKYKIKYKLHTGGVIKVEIKVTNKGECGKIISKVKKSKKIQNIKNNDIIIISTISREWVLNNKTIPPQAKVFLDIQGYVRTNEKSNKFFENSFWHKIYCIKGTEKEINKLPKNIIVNQKKKCLIITKGDKGSVIYFKNKKYIFQSNKIKAKNTIGAGDTFFAAIIVQFVKTNNIVKSTKFATKEVKKFLNNNLSNTHEKNKIKNASNKKMIIFDLDGTLYSFKGGSIKKSGLYKKILENTKKYIIEKFNKDESDAKNLLEEILREYGIFQQKIILILKIIN